MHFRVRPVIVVPHCKSKRAAGVGGTYGDGGADRVAGCAEGSCWLVPGVNDHGSRHVASVNCASPAPSS